MIKGHPQWELLEAHNRELTASLKAAGWMDSRGHMRRVCAAERDKVYGRHTSLDFDRCSCRFAGRPK